MKTVGLGARFQADTFRRMTPDTFSCRLELSTRRWYACRHQQHLSVGEQGRVVR